MSLQPIRPLIRENNGRGDTLSKKRELRRMLCAKHGVTTGRQWVRLRKAIRRAAP